MKQFNKILSGLLLLGSIFCYRAEAGGAAKIITFDVPGSTCLPAFAVCTQASAINASGAVVGIYSDSNQRVHGFLREADGSFIGIDPPAATCATPSSFFCGSRPAAINDGGVIVGLYFDPTGAHNYIRAHDGSFTSFDAPSGFFPAFQLSINPEGTVVGSFGDANGITHGFIRSRNGEISLFDPPDAVNGTNAIAISPDGTVVGYYSDTNFVQHGFVRSRDGTILSFDPQGSQATQVAGSNPAGVIVGWYQDENLITHGFIRLLNGFFVSFDAVNPSFVTFPAGVTAADVVAGSCQRPSQPFGFVRARDGSITLFNPPSSILTVVTGINDAGLVTGWYDDVGFLQHAFIRLPRQPQLANAIN